VAGPSAKGIYTRKEVCRLLNITESVLAKWEEHGFIAAAQEYSFRDLIALRTLRQLRRARFRPERIRKTLDTLRVRLRHIANPLAELKIFTDGRRLAVQVDGSKMEPLSGQLLLDFDREEIHRLLQFPGKSADANLAAALVAKQFEAERWFEKGVEVEQTGGPVERAIAAYRKALEHDPGLAGALVNLGTIYFHQRDWKQAETHYVQAVQAKPDYALAHFNLGNLYDETGDWSRALEHYLAALRLSPDYADVHYNLALLYQGRGESLNAVRHWRAYLKLDPGSYWAGIARRELARLRAETVLPGSKARSR
jgi:tetratricopeptide (TPR) repeat protein